MFDPFAWQLATVLFLAAMAWYPCCGGGEEVDPTVECVHCIGEGDNATCVSVTFSGITNGFCDECGSINGTYILEFYPYSPGTYCEWLDMSGGVACDLPFNSVFRLYGLSYGSKWWVRLVHGPSGVDYNTYDWDAPYADEKPDCMDIGLSLDYDTQATFIPSETCNVAAASVSVYTADCP